jgi:hypothetical protein
LGEVRWPEFESGLGPWQGPVIPLHHQRSVCTLRLSGLLYKAFESAANRLENRGGAKRYGKNCTVDTRACESPCVDPGLAAKQASQAVGEAAEQRAIRVTTAVTVADD